MDAKNVEIWVPNLMEVGEKILDRVEAIENIKEEIQRLQTQLEYQRNELSETVNGFWDSHEIEEAKNYTEFLHRN